MNETSGKKIKTKQTKSSVFSLLKPYSGMVVLLILFALLSNGANLMLPKIIAHSIDAYSKGNLITKTIVIQFSVASVIIFLFAGLQSIIQTYTSERVARDVRTRLSDKISRQSFTYVQQANPSKLLTNLTSDIDSIKMFVSQAVVSIASSLFIIIGASVLLIHTNWKLALAVLIIIPGIGGSFYFVLKKVRVLFKKGREVIDLLNRVISESIMGSAIIRVLNSQQLEYEKFFAANTTARNLVFSILKLFAALVPIITFFANMAVLTILALGGHLVISGKMSLGDFAAFMSYLSILIFPILIIGFMSNIIAQASASYERINSVLETREAEETGTEEILAGRIGFRNVTVMFGEKPALKDISFSVQPGTKTAVIGPTAAGKTQLLYLLTGLIKPTSGNVEFDGTDIDQFKKEAFHNQIGFVFQDSIIFNISLRENIAFNEKVTPELLEKAISTAELKNFIESLPEKMETVVSERGTSLSGGQKQRIMLARALAVNPKILLLDDFTSRVDQQTERKILDNVLKNYPGITLLSVTQKIAPVEHYDQIVLLMEGEIIAKGSHGELMQQCPEYVQIYNSQRSTSHYELQS